ncbi:hypothetical protein VNO78_35111 [Psophocarpus tetragonolobus]|uniref:Uncharacterized protein n=1 Tax=Psophocarpus tetragonolobus TaxID=3891 RepID=A0AAN9RGU7_PSOTE
MANAYDSLSEKLSSALSPTSEAGKRTRLGVASSKAGNHERPARRAGKVIAYRQTLFVNSGLLSKTVFRQNNLLRKQDRQLVELIGPQRILTQERLWLKD